MTFANVLILFLVLFATQAQARHVTFEFKFACLSVDGQPIPTGSPLAGACCSGNHLVSNPPPQCRVGFNSILGDAGGGAASSMNIAQNTLNTAQNLDGTVTDYGDENQPTPTTVSPLASSEASGITNSPLGGGFIDPKVPAITAAGEKSGSASAAAGAAGAAGLGLGSLAEDARKAAAKAQGSDGKSGQLGYVRGSGAPSGKGSNDPFAGLFGSGDKGAGAKGADELKYGEEGGNANALASADEDGVGTADDPADYLKRIDQSANIFKIVSARYMKKKSLWKVKTE